MMKQFIHPALILAYHDISPTSNHIWGKSPNAYALAFLDEMERPYSPYKKVLIIIL